MRFPSHSQQTEAKQSLCVPVIEMYPSSSLLTYIKPSRTCSYQSALGLQTKHHRNPLFRFPSTPCVDMSGDGNLIWASDPQRGWTMMGIDKARSAPTSDFLNPFEYFSWLSYHQRKKKWNYISSQGEEENNVYSTLSIILETF